MDKHEALELLSNEPELADRLPEILALKNCSQWGPHHQEGDVLVHTREVIKNLPEEASSALVWAALLHDIGKPLARLEQERGGRVVTRFFQHEVIGSQLAEKILSREKIGATIKETAVWLVRNHMRVFTLMEMNERKARDFIGHPHFLDLEKLFLADLAASWAENEEWERKKQELIAKTKEKIEEIRNRP